MDDMTLRLLGLPEETGQQITLSLQLGSGSPGGGAYLYCHRYSAVRPGIECGICYRIGELSYRICQELKGSRDENGNVMGSGAGNIQMDVNFSNSWGIQKKLDQVITESAFCDRGRSRLPGKQRQLGVHLLTGQRVIPLPWRLWGQAFSLSF